VKILTETRGRGRLVGLAVLFVLGWWLRTLQPLGLAAAVPWPWTTATLTIYFADGAYLFPLSRRVPSNTDLPRAALAALLAGPPAGSVLTSAVPPDLGLDELEIVDGIAHVRLSGSVQALREMPLGATAIVATLGRLPGVEGVALSVAGTPVTDASTRARLIYYPSAGGLVAVPAAASNPRAALEAFLAGPPAAELTRLPSDARLLGADFDQADGVIALRFAYTPSVRALALERPDRMRFLLLGLIATLTDFSEVRGVQLDFGGQSRLGLGECSDLLRTPQPRPALLNDERLIR